jgi:hypothetical protein
VIDIERVDAGKRVLLSAMWRVMVVRVKAEMELDEQGTVEILINVSYDVWLLDCRSERATQMLSTILKALF